MRRAYLLRHTDAEVAKSQRASLAFVTPDNAPYMAYYRISVTLAYASIKYDLLVYRMSPAGTSVTVLSPPLKTLTDLSLELQISLD
jgi:hypothetical protein